MSILKIGGLVVGVVVAAAIAGAATQRDNDERSKAVSTYRITAAEQPILNACETALSSNNLKFRRVSDITACGCVARKAYDGIRPDDAAYVVEALPKLIVLGVKGDTTGKRFDELAAVDAKHHFSSDHAHAVELALLLAVKACANPDTSLTPEQKAQAAADKAAKREKSLAAIEYGVQHGAYSREHAEELKARLQ